MTVDLSSYKVARGDEPMSAKFDALVQAVQDALNSLPPSQIQGYLADAARFLRGDGTWALLPRTLISDIDLTATQQFASIPGTHKHLLLVYQGRASNGGVATDVVRVRFNGDTGANYEQNTLQGNSNVAASGFNGGLTRADIGVVAGSTATANRVGYGEMFIPVYAGTVFQKVASSQAVLIGTAVNTNAYVERRLEQWNNAAAITQIDILLATGTAWAAGSRAQLYGIN